MKHNKMQIRLLVIIAAVTFGFACSPKLTSSGGAAGKYEEDLSVWRIAVVKPDTVKDVDSLKQTQNIERDPMRYVEPRHAVNANIDAILDSISRINLASGMVDGFTIQLFSGPDREQALNTRKQLAVSMPNIEADVQYVQPNYRVRTGRYYTRLEAQHDYLRIRRYFPNAIVLPVRFPIPN